jgi:hypothetical protein
VRELRETADEWVLWASELWFLGSCISAEFSDDSLMEVEINRACYWWLDRNRWHRTAESVEVVAWNQTSRSFAGCFVVMGVIQRNYWIPADWFSTKLISDGWCLPVRAAFDLVERSATCLFETQMELSLESAIKSWCFPLHSIHQIDACLDLIQLAGVVEHHRDNLMFLIGPDNATRRGFLLGWGFMHCEISKCQ